MQPSSSSRAVFAAATLGALGIFALAASGCSAACDPSAEANTPEVWSGGSTQEGGYETGPWFGPHLPFPGGKRWKLEHRLGFAPRNVSVYLAFGADNSELAPCAGNSCVFCVDSQYVWLRNDTCSEFWVRATAVGRAASNSVRLCEPGDVLDAATPDGEASADVATADGEVRPDVATADGEAPADVASADGEVRPDVATTADAAATDTTD